MFPESDICKLGIILQYFCFFIIILLNIVECMVVYYMFGNYYMFSPSNMQLHPETPILVKTTAIFTNYAKVVKGPFGIITASTCMSIIAVDEIGYRMFPQEKRPLNKLGDLIINLSKK